MPDDEALERARAARPRRSSDPKERARGAVPRRRARASCTTGTRRRALFERARADDPDLVAGDRRARDAAARPRRAVRGDRAARRGRRAAGAGRRALALARRRRRLLRRASATPTGRSSCTARRAPPIPTNHKAGVALVELCWDTGDRSSSSRRSSTSCAARTDDPGRLRGYLLQRSKVAAELGDRTGARDALARAVELDPHDLAARRELADHAVRRRSSGRRRAPLIEGLLERRGSAAARRRRSSCTTASRAARTSSATARARPSTSAITLALVPDHRAALLMRAELDAADPFALAANQLALANIAPPEEKATRFAALGDRYVELGDRATAREMYREALRAPARRSPAADEVPRASSPTTATGATASISSSG